MLAGDQMVMLRKGGIGEKRFDVPHREFVLLPTHVHQRPELLAPEALRMLLFGLAMVVIMLYRPRGLLAPKRAL